MENLNAHSLIMTIGVLSLIVFSNRFIHGVLRHGYCHVKKHWKDMAFCIIIILSMARYDAVLIVFVSAVMLFSLLFKKVFLREKRAKESLLEAEVLI